MQEHSAHADALAEPTANGARPAGVVRAPRGPRPRAGNTHARALAARAHTHTRRGPITQTRATYDDTHARTTSESRLRPTGVSPCGERRRRAVRGGSERQRDHCCRPTSSLAARSGRRSLSVGHSASARSAATARPSSRPRSPTSASPSSIRRCSHLGDEILSEMISPGSAGMTHSRTHTRTGTLRAHATRAHNRHMIDAQALTRQAHDSGHTSHD